MEQEVRVYRDTGRWDIAHILDGLELVGVGQLTTHRSESSYGQPILVVGGLAYTAWEAERSGLSIACLCAEAVDEYRDGYCQHKQAWSQALGR